MAIVFKTPKSTLNTTSKQIQNLGGDCPPCPEPVLEGKELEYTQNGEYTVTPEQGVDGFSSIDVTVNVPSDVNNQDKTVSPSTSSQTVEADSGYSGLGTVTVDAVTSSIDNNISAGNIKKDVTILGVTGNYDPQPNLSNLNITPSTNAQEYNPAISGVDGYSLVSVSAVTAAIDNNIAAGNIKSGVSILGVTGNYDPQPDLQAKTVNPSTSQQTVTPDQGKDGLSSVTVNAVTAAIDANISAGNIKKDVEILGVTGNYDPQPDLEAKTVNSSTVQQVVTPTAGKDGLSSVTVEPYVLQAKTATPTTSQQVIEADNDKDGLSSVTVSAVTSSIDANISAGNIKKDITILGVTGSYDPQPNLDTLNVTPSTSAQTITPTSPVDGFDEVVVSAVDSTIDANILSNNIKQGVTILGVAGSYTAQPNLQDKSVTPTTSQQVISADGGYDGLDEVTVSAVTSAIDQNIVAGNIRDGVTILGVLGTYSGGIPAQDPFWIQSLEDGNTVAIGNRSESSQSLPFNMEYSLDGTTWTAVSFTRNQFTSISLDEGDIVYFRGNNPTLYKYDGGMMSVRFKSSKTVNIGGYICSLLSANNYVDYRMTANSAFMYIFRKAEYTDDVLKVISAEDLILPNDTLQSTYACLFDNNTYLVTPPALPANVICERAYDKMFEGCTSLATAPVLPARCVMVGGYASMFSGCTSLTSVPALPAYMLAKQCYSTMFKNCTGLTTVPNDLLSAGTTAYEHMYSYMFEGCTNLTNAPELPITTIGNNTSYVYAGMFKNCTSLTESPVLPVTYLNNAAYGYQNMFNGCTNLNKVTCLATSWSTSNNHTFDNWLDGVAATGTFYKNANASGWPTGVSGIPTGWTVEDYVSA